MIVFYKIYNKKDQFSEYFFWGGWVDFVLKCLYASEGEQHSNSFYFEGFLLQDSGKPPFFQEF